MGLRITTNEAALNASKTLGIVQRDLNKNLMQLASGSRIGKAGDDAASLAISENLNSQIRSSVQAQRNSNDAISIMQVAEGGLNEVSNILVRMRELGVQAASDTVADTERGFSNKELEQLKSEIDRISNTTTWGKTQLLNGASKDLEFQIGINNDKDADRITFSTGNTNSTLGSLAISDVSFLSKEQAQNSLDAIDQAFSKVGSFRAHLGAFQNSIQSSETNIAVSIENLSAAHSRIRDTDYAAASTQLSRDSLLMNANAAVLAQANQSPQIALKLIG